MDGDFMLRTVSLLVLALLIMSSKGNAATIGCYEGVFMTYSGGHLGVYQGLSTDSDPVEAKFQARLAAEKKCASALENICRRQSHYSYQDCFRAYRCISWGCKEFP